MRMWMVHPSLLCRQHLLGEHSEIHKHRYNFVKGHNVHGRVHPVVQIEPMSMQSRHDELVQEMTRRGYNHKSPYQQPDLSGYDETTTNARVDVQLSLNDLSERCENCKSRIEKGEQQ